MAHAILMPKPGQMTEECTVVSWHKTEGDPVKRGDVLFEIETDKSTMEVEAFDDGVLLRIVAPEGAVVPVNTVCAYVGEPGEAIPEAAPAAADRSGARGRPPRCPSPSAAPARRGSSGARDVRSGLGPGAGGPPPDQPARQPGGGRGGIDPRTITGSGPGGRITERDVLAAIAAAAAASRRPARRRRTAAPGMAAAPAAPRVGPSRERSARDPPRRRGGGAATAQPDAPGDRRSPDPRAGHRRRTSR